MGDSRIVAGQEADSHAQAKLGFARKLASPNKKTREKAISLLVLWLTSQKQVKEDELKKIWKGLFYCVWHSDKLPVQAELIERLASLAEKLDIALSLHFFEVFLSTMRREWGGIDRLRLDKFYLFLSKYLVHMLVVLENSGWDADCIRKFMDALVERTFLVEDQYAALGINLHYADIFLKELEKFLPLQAETFRLLLEPFLHILANASDKSFLKRVRENIFDRLLDFGRTVLLAKQDGNDLDSNIETLGSIVLSLPIASEAFKLASMSSTPQSNRRMLYELHEEFSKLEKLLTLSGITISVPSVKNQKKALGGREHRQKFAVSDLMEKDRGSAERKATLVSREQAKAVKKLESDGSKRKKPASSAGMTSADVSMAMTQVNETLSPKLEEKPEDLAGKGKKVVSSEKKRKLSIQKITRADMTENSPGRQKEATDSAKGHKKKGRQRSLEKGIEMTGTDRCKELTYREESSSAGGETCSSTEASRLRVTSGENGLRMDDPVVSNLKNLFDSIAAEGSSELDTCLSPISLIPVAVSPRNTGSKKRKRAKSTPVSSPWNGKENGVSPSSPVVNGGDSTGTRSGKKAKKVRFSLKNNIVWKPYCPLPPQILRVPPSATPRGSALKKGVPPGPVLFSKEVLPKQRKGTPRRPAVQSSIKILKSLARGSKVTNKHRHSPR